MVAAKQKMKEVIESQPEDATYDEILRELTFERMVDRGLARIPEQAMPYRTRKWNIAFAHGRSKMDGLGRNLG